MNHNKQPPPIPCGELMERVESFPAAWQPALKRTVWWDYCEKRGYAALARWGGVVGEMAEVGELVARPALTLCLTAIGYPLEMANERTLAQTTWQNDKARVNPYTNWDRGG
jgi:hypothetical protein